MINTRNGRAHAGECGATPEKSDTHAKVTTLQDELLENTFVIPCRNAPCTQVLADEIVDDVNKIMGNMHLLQGLENKAQGAALTQLDLLAKTQDTLDTIKAKTVRTWGHEEIRSYRELLLEAASIKQGQALTLTRGTRWREDLTRNLMQKAEGRIHKRLKDGGLWTMDTPGMLVGVRGIKVRGSWDTIMVDSLKDHSLGENIMILAPLGVLLQMVFLYGRPEDDQSRGWFGDRRRQVMPLTNEEAAELDPELKDLILGLYHPEGDMDITQVLQGARVLKTST